MSFVLPWWSTPAHLLKLQTIGMGGCMCCVELYHSSTVGTARAHGAGYAHAVTSSTEIRPTDSVFSVEGHESALVSTSYAGEWDRNTVEAQFGVTRCSQNTVVGRTLAFA